MKTSKSAYKVLISSLIAFCVLSLIAISAGWFFVLKMSGEVNETNTEIQNMRRESDKLSELSIRYQKVSDRKGLVIGTIPTTKDESTFMADLEATAKKNNLTINSSIVGNSQTKSTKSSEFSQTVKKQEYYELPIRYEVGGQYADFVKFVGDLSNLRRLNSVNDVAVTADLSDKSVAGKVKATFNVIIYAKK